VSASSLVRGAEQIVNLDGSHAIAAGICGRMAPHSYMNDRKWTRRPLLLEWPGHDTCFFTETTEQRVGQPISIN
jgi:hypothetical protein